MPSQRFVQIYTGNGKGKTTAAIGQAVRAASAGLRTLIIAFMKEYPYGEFEALRKLGDYIVIESYGGDDFVYKKQSPGEQDKAAIRKGLARAEQAVFHEQFDMVVLDEACVAVYFGLMAADALLPLLDNRPDGVEVVITGRYCPAEWLERADLVSEMREVRHYYQKGVLARRGFES